MITHIPFKHGVGLYQIPSILTAKGLMASETIPAITTNTTPILAGLALIFSGLRRPLALGHHDLTPGPWRGYSSWHYGLEVRGAGKDTTAQQYIFRPGHAATTESDDVLGEPIIERRDNDEVNAERPYGVILGIDPARDVSVRLWDIIIYSEEEMDIPGLDRSIGTPPISHVASFVRSLIPMQRQPEQE